MIYFRVWKTTRKHNPRLRIHLVTEGRHKNEIMFQQKAPVKSIVYDTPYNKVNDDVIMFIYIILDFVQAIIQLWSYVSFNFQVSPFYINLIVELYRTDLETYVHHGIPRFYTAKSFHDRADSTYLYLVRQCPYIHTLVREIMFTFTNKN